MNCTECQDQILDDLTETLAPEQHRLIEVHLMGCEPCRSWRDSTRQLWAELGTLPQPIAPAGRAAEIVAAASGSSRRRTAGRWLAYAASLGLVFWAGRAMAPAGSSLASPPAAPAAAPPAGDTPTWLLLLREPTGAPIVAAGTPAEVEVVREYGAWAGALAQAGQLLAAEKLADPTSGLLPGGYLAEATTISGFFLIRAADSAEASRIARESPHVRHGGMIELRRIDPT